MKLLSWQDCMHYVKMSVREEFVVQGHLVQGVSRFALDLHEEKEILRHNLLGVHANTDNIC